MNLRFEDEVSKDLEDIPEDIENKILSNIFELEKKPLPDNSYVIQLPDGTEIQCLKLQEQDRNSELSYRITYDIENKEVRIYGVFHRRPGYQKIKQKTQERK